MDDRYDLERFVVAQNRDGVYDQAVSELQAGRKQTDWMWFVFPQLLGLGSSTFASHFGIASADEASAYLAHDVLGPRLRRCTQLVSRSGAVSAAALLGGDVDALKLRSSMTLFAAIAADPDEFVTVLRKFYHGGRDVRSLRILGSHEAESKVGASAPVTSRRMWSWRGRRTKN